MDEPDQDHEFEKEEWKAPVQGAKTPEQEGEQGRITGKLEGAERLMDHLANVSWHQWL